MNSAEIAAMVTVMTSIIGFLGVTGIDASQVQNAIMGFVAFAGICTSIWSYLKHRQNRTQ